MDYSIFSRDDLERIEALGMTREQVISQIDIYKKKSSYLKLNRPCTIGDGIRAISEDEVQDLILRHQDAAGKGRFLKFVPASGAASRMFKALLQLRSLDKEIHLDDIAKRAGEGNIQTEEVLAFIKGVRQFAFFNDIELVIAESGLDANSLISEDRFGEIIEYLLTSRGLNYAELPKGLLKFHQYPDGSRTAFEEHLVEATDYARDADGVSRLHFTVSSEHLDGFRALLEEVGPRYENKYNARFKVDFSLQKRSTDTIAVDMENQPFREKDGGLLFRPGGHGALIENLNDLKGNIIFIKNIDNVVPDRLKEATFVWKRVLAGYLIEIQEEIFNYLGGLSAGKQEESYIEEILNFAGDKLSISTPGDWQRKSSNEKREFLINKLNRPIRVCGMVKNEGEPGGGPFWVDEKAGDLSLQIVESAQVEPESGEQHKIFASGTHFNPVDIVCGVRDYKGDTFDLRNYVDRDAVFISTKSKDGRDLKALELPGLWNGAMADWNTVFVEVPIITFNPVKTINDLLRKEHQTA